MYFTPPNDWIEIDEAALQQALDVLDYRIDGLGYWYERHNGKRFALKHRGNYLGSPEYFSPIKP